MYRILLRKTNLDCLQGILFILKILDFELSSHAVFEIFLSRMTTLLKNFVNSHPTFTLSKAEYGRHFHLGDGVNIPSSPTQRLHNFVETERTPRPYRFIVVGRLMSFKVVDDPVCRVRFNFEFK